MDKMPTEIKVGCHVYSVLRKTKQQMPDCLGECDFDNLQISVRKSLRLSKAQETILHETLHACTDPSLKEGKAREEDFVNTVSPVLLQVLKDNPELVKYLTAN